MDIQTREVQSRRIPRPEWVPNTANSGEMRPWWRIAPYDRRSILWFVIAFVVMSAIWTAVGFAVVQWLEPSEIGKTEVDFARSLEDARNPFRDDLAVTGSLPSNVPVKIGLITVLLIVFPAMWRRWHDWAFLAGALLVEVSVYGLSSYLVGRPRPPVERLAEAPTESWPSGHVAAAVVFYVGMAMVVGWHHRNTLLRTLSYSVAVLVVIAMVVSRIYLGMHFVSDVIGGLLLGTTSLVVTRRIIGHSSAFGAPSDPPQTRTLDLTASPPY